MAHPPAVQAAIDAVRADGEDVAYLPSAVQPVVQALRDTVWPSRRWTRRYGEYHGYGGETAAYTANPVNFDGSTTYLSRASDYTGNVNSSMWTGSLWLRKATNGVTLNIAVSTSDKIAVRFLSSDNLIYVIGKNTSSVEILRLTTTNTVTGTGWHHVMWSVDVTDTGKRHLYVDGVSTMTVVTYDTTGGAIDFTVSFHAIGANTSGTARFSGDLADLQMWFGAYVDLSVVGNRELFIKDGAPVDPALAAASALGNPIVRLSGPTVDWHINKGTGGDFTENGALTDGTVELP